MDSINYERLCDAQGSGHPVRIRLRAGPVRSGRVVALLVEFTGKSIVGEVRIDRGSPVGLESVPFEAILAVAPIDFPSPVLDRPFAWRH